LTPPVPRSLALLDAGQAAIPLVERKRLEAIEYQSCLALMAVTESRTAIPRPGGIRFREGPIAWLADNSLKGISPSTGSVTLHASSEFSQLHWETSDSNVAPILFQKAGPWIQSAIRSFRIHRWRYSQPVSVYPSPCLRIDGDAPLVFAGDAFGGPRVEGAALSGLAAAKALLKSNSGR
jgi:predicted NAD/FAD-dependent oxidoreductase